MTRNTLLNSLTRNISWNPEPAIPPLLTKWYYFLGKSNVSTHPRKTADTKYFLDFLDTKYFLERRLGHTPTAAMQNGFEMLGISHFCDSRGRLITSREYFLEFLDTECFLVTPLPVRCKSEFSLGKTHFCNGLSSRLFRF